MKINKKGFTLIELLAVIVILSILLAIAIPAVAKYINSARKSTYINNVQSYVKAARQEALVNNGQYVLPINNKEATVISFKRLESALDNGGKTSSYGGTFIETKSFVIIVNEGNAEDPKYGYYIAAIDSKGYGLGTVTTSGTTTTTAAATINYDSLKDANVVQLGTESSKGVTRPTAVTSSTTTFPKLTVTTINGDTTTTLEATVKNTYY